MRKSKHMIRKLKKNKSMNEKLTIEFLTNFHKNLLIENPMFDEDYYHGYIGTLVWNNAFKQTCIELSCEHFYVEYESLEWDKSDEFDNLIINSLINSNILLKLN